MFVKDIQVKMVREGENILKYGEERMVPNAVNVDAASCDEGSVNVRDKVKLEACDSRDQSRMVLGRISLDDQSGGRDG